MDITDEVQLIRIALAADDNKLTEHAAEAVRRRAELNPDARSLKAVAAHAAGLMNHSEKDLAEAVDLYEHLFLSPHTVSGHLRHVVAKLGVNSRFDLARVAAGADR
jgi:DNA-binding NarL/FixJ family response regulator